jgi:hypothetical protein
MFEVALQASIGSRIIAQIHVPIEHLGGVLKLCQDRRGVQRDLLVHSDKRAVVRYELPLAEVLVGFYDRLKSATRGYASMDYELLDYQPADLVKVDVLVNGDPVDALSIIVRRRLPERSGTDPGAQAAHSETDVRGGSPGLDREPDYRAGVGPGASQERDRQVLRRGHYAQAEAPREAEGGQEAHETDRKRGDSPGGLPGCPECGRGRALKMRFDAFYEAG